MNHQWQDLNLGHWDQTQALNRFIILSPTAFSIYFLRLLQENS